MKQGVVITTLIVLFGASCSTNDEPEDCGARALCLPPFHGDASAERPAHVDAESRDAAALVDADAAAALTDASGPNPSTLVWFVPPDHTTNVADRALGLSVYSYSPERSRSEILTELEASLELVEWPSASPVPAHVSHDVSVPPYQMQVAIEPDDPLREGWYALRLRMPVPGIRFNVLGSEVLDGRPTSRFRVGSEPLVTRIELCEKADARSKLIVSLSEYVRATKPLDATVVVTGGSSTPCQGAYLQNGNDMAQLTVACGALTSEPWLRVVLEGVESLTGVRLTDASGAAPDYAFEPSRLPELGGCRVFVPAPGDAWSTPLFTPRR